MSFGNSNFSLSDNNNWKSQKPKKTNHFKKPVNRTKPPTKRLDTDKPSSVKITITKCIKQFDERLKLNFTEREKCFNKIINAEPLLPEEICAAAKMIFGIDINMQQYMAMDWAQMTEIDNYAIDLRRIAKNEKPMFSDSLCGNIIVGESIEIIRPIDNDSVTDSITGSDADSVTGSDAESVNENINENINETADFQIPEHIGNGSDHLLPSAIALIMEWQISDTEWSSRNIAVMKTISDFWSYINFISKDDTFNMPLKNKMNDAAKVYARLRANMKKSTTKNSKFSTNNDAKMYNSYYPVWSFVKVSHSATIDDKINVPFIRNEHDKNLNDININIREMDGIPVIGHDFMYGYIPLLILEFIGNAGNIPSEMSSIVFRKSMIRDGANFYEGYRVRVLVEPAKLFPQFLDPPCHELSAPSKVEPAKLFPQFLDPACHELSAPSKVEPAKPNLGKKPGFNLPCPQGGRLDRESQTIAQVLQPTNLALNKGMNKVPIKTQIKTQIKTPIQVALEKTEIFIKKDFINDICSYDNGYGSYDYSACVVNITIPK